MKSVLIVLLITASVCANFGDGNNSGSEIVETRETDDRASSSSNSNNNTKVQVDTPRLPVDTSHLGPEFDEPKAQIEKMRSEIIALMDEIAREREEWATLTEEELQARRDNEFAYELMEMRRIQLEMDKTRKSLDHARREHKAQMDQPIQATK